MAENKETRDRVRELVKQVLATVPTEDEMTRKTPENYPQRVVVNSMKDEIGKEFDRDESAKSLITEDDLRGLDFGAKLRIADNAKFTPLADDIIREKRIVLIRKSARRGSLACFAIVLRHQSGRMSRVSALGT